MLGLKNFPIRQTSQTSVLVSLPLICLPVSGLTDEGELELANPRPLSPVQITTTSSTCPLQACELDQHQGLSTARSSSRGLQSLL